MKQNENIEDESEDKYEVKRDILDNYLYHNFL